MPIILFIVFLIFTGTISVDPDLVQGCMIGAILFFAFEVLRTGIAGILHCVRR
jgi:hypothetical protein